MHAAFIICFLLGLAFWGYSVTIWRRHSVLPHGQQLTNSASRLTGMISVFVGFAFLCVAFYFLTKFPGG